MSGQPPLLDPRLDKSITGQNQQRHERPPLPQLPPLQSTRQQPLEVPNANGSTPLKPFYPYPASQAHTPQQNSTSANQSNHHSPTVPTTGAHLIPVENNDEHHSPDADGNGQNADDAKRPRACEACRGLKVRCDQDPAHPELPCRRCQKAGRQCIITTPSRKRQKKSDGRVAELEKKLDQLTAVLQQQQQQQQHRHHPAQPQNYTQYNAPQRPDPPHMLNRSNSASHVPLNPYSQSSPASARPASADQTSLQPAQKRRRIDDVPKETESLDGAGVSNTVPMDRYKPGKQSHETSTQPHREFHEPWVTNGDAVKYLIHRSPEEFMNRINQLVSPEIGTSIFNRYVTKLAPHMPAVVFQSGTTADQVWKEKPILYVCILSATSAGFLHPDIAKQLAKEAIRAIADCVVCNGAKSLELIQAMQVLALWYKPPEKSEQTNFYQIIHMAAVMALDIGLGKRFNAAKSRRGFGGPHSDYAPGAQLIPPQNSDTMEARRAWLCCYYLCASASMVLRRPNLLRWSHYMKECIDILESSPEAFESDKLFCQHIRVQHICEDIGQQFSMDDNTADVSITDPKVSYALNVLENDLKNWVDHIPPELKHNRGLEFFKHVASLYLHEIALHFNHNIEDFRLPFTEESLRAVNNTSEKLTQNQMAALENCWKSAHGILDTILTFDVDTVKSLPMLIFFVRCTYGLVVILKLHVAISTPGSEIAKIMKTEDLRVDYYIDSLMTLFRDVASEQEYRSHPKVLRILSVLKDWFRKHKENVAAQSRGDQLPHSTSQSQRGQQDQTYPANQTPLHLLSQLATDGQAQQQQQQQQGQDQRDSRSQGWTFSTPQPINYGRKINVGDPSNMLPAAQQQQHQQQQVYPPMGLDDGAFDGGMGEQYGLDGQLAPEYLWGSGFEQAMEINLGDMAGLSNNGMDGLFLGGGMAPFNFAGDSTAGQW